WHLEEPLRRTVFLCGLAAYCDQRFEDASERFREAGNLGFRDRRLGPLLALSLFKAGQRLLYQENANGCASMAAGPVARLQEAPPDDIPVALLVPSRFEAGAERLEQAIRAGCQDPQAPYLLALPYKRQGKTAEARAALRKIGRPDGGLFLQLGLLALEEGQLAQAEQEFARAWELSPTSFASGRNLLLTRLSLDRIDDAEALIDPLLPLAPGPEEQRHLTFLQGLLRTCQSAAGETNPDPILLELTPTDEQGLVELARSLGQIDTALALLRTLAAARRGSAAVQE